MTISLVPLEDFVGNGELRETFARISLPAVSLFTGPTGVGKKTLAISLAARLNCRSEKSGFCGSCSSCLKIQGGNHPDVILADRDWVEATMQAVKKSYNPRVITIDVARALVREAQYRPFESERRVFILDEVDKLNSSASNALLKTLEEPLLGTHFVLITAHPEKLLPTILSRCQRFAFHGLERSELESYLEMRGLDAAPERAAFAQGSIGRALALDLERILEDRNRMLKLLEGWSRTQSFAPIYQACHSQPLAADLKDRERVHQMLEQLSGLAEDLYFLITDQAERVVSQDRIDRLRKLAQQIDLDWVRVFLYYVQEAAADIDHYITPQVCLEAIWLETLTSHARDRSRSLR